MEPTQVLPLLALSESDLLSAAAEIQCLDLASSECQHHTLFRNVPLPNLRSVSIDSSEDNSSGRLLEPYLQPGLRVFEFFGGVLDDQFLSDLAVSFRDKYAVHGRGADRWGGGDRKNVRYWKKS